MMLPATLVTFTTFLFKLCSTSPVYNMQPAFITNTVGVTTGRNIRNLPCISRRNSNQSGFCMFAIDCLKANGTHLGTCIDGFYFGSCCYIEPVRDIIDNNLETDIIPHDREPPFRISSTTPKIISTTTQLTTLKNTTEKIVQNKTNTTIKTPSVVKNVTSTPIPDKLHTFQTWGSNSVQELSTKASTTLTKNVTVEVTTSSPVTKAPLSKKPTLVTTTVSPITTAKYTNATTTTTTTVKSKITTVTTTTTSKPTKVSTTKITSKPTKAPSKPSRFTTTKKPELGPTKPLLVTKPTKKVTQTTKYTTPKTSTTEKQTIKTKPTQKVPATTSTTTTTEKSTSTTSIKPITTSPSVVTTASNNISVVTTSSPVTVSTKNVTTAAPEPGVNVTTEDWVPITTPDGWVLLSNAGTNQNTTDNKTITIVTTPSTTTTTSIPESTKINVTEITTSSSSTSSSPSMQSEASSPNVATVPVEIVTGNPPDMELIDKPINMSDYTDVCGRRIYPEARIVGGEKSSFGKWPWQISLRQWRTSTYLHKCGAALLNENWAITAAHCVDNVPPSDLLLRLGEYDLSTESEPYLHQERRVQIVASHPQFDPRTFEYDLALLRFYEPVNFQPNILPVCVPQNDENFVGRNAFVTGWGRLYEDGPLPSILQEVSVPVINNTLCESMYRSAGYIEHIPHIFICAGWRRGGFDSCEGDSGGPMVIQRPDKRYLLAGVISWGIGCAEPNQPGVYTRISEFRDWINQILQF